MQPFTLVRGPAAPFPTANIDTDVIMPKQFLKGVDRKGLDRGAFFDLRFDADHKPKEDFILNKAGWQNACFLVTGANFGCGSSREHAVWGLSQLGIRALIGTSFAGIFNDNCQRNGILTVTLPPQIIEKLMMHASDSATNVLTVDLPAQTITIDAIQHVVSFDIEPLRKESLLQGLDAVSATLVHHTDRIRAFEQTHRQMNPWFF